MYRYLFKLFSLSLLLWGCSVSTPKAGKEQIVELSLLLYSLNQHIPKEESLKLSKDIFYKTQRLTEEFDLTSPPLWHNFLVNIGIREKGLCYHWSDALYLYLNQKGYNAFRFHLMGANIGEYWREHNSLVITAKGVPVEEGIIIDPWRDSGRLYFSKVKEDKEYHWKHRADRGCMLKR